jgi:hypothetical protein
MLATDIFMDVRAARAISPDQITRLESLVFSNGAPSGDQLDLLYLMDTYLQRPDPRWADLLARAAIAIGSVPEAAAA